VGGGPQFEFGFGLTLYAITSVLFLDSGVSRIEVADSLDAKTRPDNESGMTRKVLRFIFFK
jgi:hypothetical protein